jgi:hypothetical protein
LPAALRPAYLILVRYPCLYLNRPLLTFYRGSERENKGGRQILRRQAIQEPLRIAALSTLAVTSTTGMTSL